MTVNHREQQVHAEWEERNLFALFRRGIGAELQCCRVLKKSKKPNFTSTSGSASITAHRIFCYEKSEMSFNASIISPTIFTVTCISSSSVFPLKHSTIAAELDFWQPATAAIFCKQKQTVLGTFPLSGSMRHQSSSSSRSSCTRVAGAWLVPASEGEHWKPSQSFTPWAGQKEKTSASRFLNTEIF